MVSIAQLRNADRHWTGYRRPGRNYCCFSVPVPKSLRKAMHSVCAKIFWYFTILRPEIWIMTRILGGSRIADTPPIPMICWWLMMVPEIVILLWHDTKPNQIGWITSPLRTLVLSKSSRRTILLVDHCGTVPKDYYHCHSPPLLANWRHQNLV